MHHMRLALVWLLVVLAALALAWTPIPSNAQAALLAPTSQPTLVSQGSASSQTVASTPAVEPSAPIGERTQQFLIILGVVILLVLLLSGGIYLRKRWMAGGW